MIISGLDTMIVIYAMKHLLESATPEEVDLRRRTIILLEDLRREKARIVIPTVTIWEVLTGIPQHQHGVFLAKLNERFFPKPMDLAVSAFAADLWIRHRGLPPADQMRRSILKVDCLVVASAKMAGAGDFYSHDNACRDLARLAGMKGKDLPSHSSDLLLDAELRRGDAASGLEIE